MAVLGGIVAGPALAVMGFTIGAKAKANKEAAYANRAQARKIAEEIKVATTACNAIADRANMFRELLRKVESDVFFPLLGALERTLAQNGADYGKYDRREKEVVAANLAVAKAVKSILDTPILTEDGSLTDESDKLLSSVEQDMVKIDRKRAELAVV